MPEPHLRAADADRAGVADVLGRHMSAGRLTVAEYDDRLARAYAARTYGELDALTADLPAVQQPAAVPEPDAQPVPGTPCAGPAGYAGAGWARAGTGGWTGSWGPWAGGSGMRAAWASWASTAVIVIGIWLLTSLASDSWIYPWPMWVVGPWGVVLLAQSLGLGGRHDQGRNRNRDRDRNRAVGSPGH